jgi:hypothetical protein
MPKHFSLLFEFGKGESLITAALLVCGIIIAFWKGWPQAAISALQAVESSQSKALAILREELAGYKADVGRLMREVKVYVDGQEQDQATIARLKADLSMRDDTIIELRRELNEALRREADAIHTTLKPGPGELDA